MRWWPFGSRTGDTPHGAARASQERDERLSAYLDDDLTAEERSALDAELADDETLRDDLTGMRAVTVAMGQLEPVRAPRPFTLAARPASSRRPRVLDLGLQIGAALSALLLVVAIVDPGDGGGITTSAVPIEQSRATASTQPTDAGAAAGGSLAVPESTPSAPADGESGDTAYATDAATEPGEPSTPSESLQAAPPGATSGGSEEVPAPVDATGDGPVTAPPPADTGPGELSSTGGAGGDAPTFEATAGDGDDSAAALEAQPVPGTGEGLPTSDLGGGDRDFVPALAVLTALLTALVALRWAQTRRTA